MYFCVFVCISVCFYVFLCVCIYFCVFVCISVYCMYFCVFVCVSVCLYVFLYVCMYFCKFVCISVCFYVFLCILMRDDLQLRFNTPRLLRDSLLKPLTTTARKGSEVIGSMSAFSQLSYLWRLRLFTMHNHHISININVESI